MKINIAIDGPSASGKSTVAKQLCSILNYVHLDTGAMYRCVALEVKRKNIDIEDVESIVEMLNSTKIQLTTDGKVYLNDEDVTDIIRTNEISLLASDVSTIKEVREHLVALQQKMAQDKGFIMDGRDIGTVVLPDAELKIYLTASVEARAKRRYLENKERGLESNLQTLKNEILERDYQDTHRKYSPLKQATDAVVVDSTEMDKDDVVNYILELVKDKIWGVRMLSNTVAIVGRPNVGKSTIFNRMIGERVSIVDETAGVTRDRIYGKCQWLTKEFSIIDTGGIQIQDQPFQKEIQAQVDIAIEEADTIIMLCNIRDGVTSDDQYIAKLLKKTNKKVLLAVNKVDDISFINGIYDFYSLGLGDPIAVSATQAIGIGDLMDAIINSFDQKEINSYDSMISFAVIGRPNVGKSSLVNAILNQERVIVSNIEGTTRDAIDTPFEREGKSYVVIDTAGIRKKGKIYENIEKYSLLRAMKAIDRSNVVLFVLDGSVGLTEQDKHVAGYAIEAGKGIIIVYNKWDLVDKDHTTMDKITKHIRTQLPYLDYAPIVFVSALNKQRVQNLFPLIDEVYDYSKFRVSTSLLNEVISDAQITTPPPTHNGKRLKINFASQIKVAPPTFAVFVNDENLLHFSYSRYLENKLREAFEFTGNPIKIIARKKN